MNRIWTVLFLASAAAALVTGHAGNAASSLLESGTQAVELLLTLLATMTLWSGLMEILTASGDVARLGRLFRRVARPLFPGLRDEECWSAMGMNLAANLLGLGNAATPAGVEAAKLLSRQGEAGLQALAMLLALDNAGLQLLPTTVITLRQAAGSADPASIWLPTLIVSGASSVAAVLLMRIVNRGGALHGRNLRGGDHCRDRADRPAGASLRH